MSPDRIALRAPGSVLAQEHVLALAPGEVGLWAFELAADASTLARCEALLSPAEVARADRFAFPVLRERFVLAHGLVRHVLARYAGKGAAALEFVAAADGKPALANASGVSFNLSDSHERAVLAVADGREVGVDVEQERPNVDALSIAESYFFGSELAAIRDAPRGEERARFFRYWAAKEAVLKGEGCGLGFPLDRFEVVFGADATTARVRSLEPARVRADWTVRMLSLGPGWPVAVAVRGEDWRLSLDGA